MRYKLFVVVGTRPQYIKAAPLLAELKENKAFDVRFIDTGQHYDHILSGRFIEELELPKPDYNLKIHSDDQAIQISKILLRLSPIIKKEMPDLVIVFGDTNSTTGASLCAASYGIPVAHVESGLREWNKKIPEEINKLVTDSITDIYFCPSLTAVKNLRKSGISENIHNVGDIGIDTIKSIEINKNTIKDCLSKYNLKPKGYYFITLHRASNTNNLEALESILLMIGKLNLPVILPIHPGTFKRIRHYNLLHLLQKPFIQLLEPIGFVETQILIKNAKLVITDSGGIIKEAYYHKVQSIILDHQTEWIEIVKSGWALFGLPNIASVNEIIRNIEKPPKHNQYYGNGGTSKKIVSIIYEFLQSKK